VADVLIEFTLLTTDDSGHAFSKFYYDMCYKFHRTKAKLQINVSAAFQARPQ